MVDPVICKGVVDLNLSGAATEGDPMILKVGEKISREASEKIFLLCILTFISLRDTNFNIVHTVVLFLFSIRYLLPYDLIKSEAAESTVFTTCKFQKM